MIINTSVELVDLLRPMVAGRRTAWLTGTRGEALMLGDAFKQLCRGPKAPSVGWLLATSEHGMALQQALDFCELIPDEVAPQCHPAEEPAQRLQTMLERAEAFGRQRKVERIIFSGWGPTAVGAALYAHARRGGGVWVRPPDPAGLISRLRWEAGLERVIRSLAPAVEIIELEALPWSIGGNGHATEIKSGGSSDESDRSDRSDQSDRSDFSEEMERTHFDASKPCCVIAVFRREWGLFDETFTRLAHAIARCGRAYPQWQFVVLSMLNARLERPLRTLKEPAENVLLVPPLPFPVYRALLAKARAVVTDSPLVAAEALEHGIPLAALGESAGEDAEKAGPIENVTMQLIVDDFLGGWIERLQ